MPRSRQITVSLLTPALDNVCLDQTTPGAADFTITGTLASGGSVTLVTAHRLDIQSVGNMAAVVFTIVGTDNDGKALSEDISGLNNNTITTTSYFKTITSVSVDAAVGTATSIGTTDEALMQTYPTNRYAKGESSVGVGITGTINATVQETLTNPQSGLTMYWQASTLLTGLTANTDASISSPVSALRVVVNSYTAAATLVFNIVEP